ncbi:unnamed protein product [Oppiella nova]|uniref:PH domain-containing protein n=2 Tax=Oppiella nova TaxID=334625 RepID=A0A7R9QEJ4_9ACAR|nr:unnamed protein product [Oppiella nova]CAG2164205.1 unnamed protein product [Oppiella nova]
MTSSSSDTTSSSMTGTSPLVNKMSISMVSTDPSTIKKGLLWQQRDRFFSRWKERYFVLTKDYLSCFKKGSKVGMSEMGSFMYKLTLVDVEGLNWADKKRDGVIAIRVGTGGQLLLWSNTGLDEWMFALREAVNRSKGRREALRKSQTLLPSMTGGGIWNRQKISSLHYTLGDSPVGVSNTTSRLHRATSADFTNCEDANRQLRSTIHHNPTPVLNRRFQRISVLTDIDLSLESASGERRSLAPRDEQPIANRAGLPRLAPQCGGNNSHVNANQIGNSSQNSSLQSLVSLGRTTGQLVSHQFNRPSPRSLQVSPALAQRSLYAQHILSSPEIIGVNTTDSRHHQMAKSALKNISLESASGERRSLTPRDEQPIPNRAGLPRLAPQCGGNNSHVNANQIGNSSQNSSLQSLVSLGRTTGQLVSHQFNRPSPRSLQVSPALAQRSLYAQHILSSPEIIGVNTTDSRHHQMAKSALNYNNLYYSYKH